jgi:hypothetical protein
MEKSTSNQTDRLKRTRIRLGEKINQSAARIRNDFCSDNAAKLCGQLAQGSNPFTRSSFQGDRREQLVTRAVARCGPETKQGRKARQNLEKFRKLKTFGFDKVPEITGLRSSLSFDFGFLSNWVCLMLTLTCKIGPHCTTTDDSLWSA